MKTHEIPAPFSLEGEVALVTGGGTGLGKTIAACLAAAGAMVAITGRRQAVLDEAARAVGPQAVPVRHDVTELETLPQLISEVESRLGPLTILVNNAGIHLKKPALDTTDGDFADIVHTHVAAAFALSREAARVMLPRNRGSILFIGSMASFFGIPEVAAYSAAKAAVLGLTRELTVEWAGHGIRVNAIAPGWISSGMAESTLDAHPTRKSRILARTPMQRLGIGEDIGWAAVYLCSPAAQFVTGTTLIVDGGASIGF